MIDLESNPTKLIEIVEIGKQLLMTRGSHHILHRKRPCKIFFIIPAAFVSTFPALGVLNILGLHNAILSAVISCPHHCRTYSSRPPRGCVPSHDGRGVIAENILIYGIGGVIARSSDQIIDIILMLIGM